MKGNFRCSNKECDWKEPNEPEWEKEIFRMGRRTKKEVTMQNKLYFCEVKMKYEEALELLVQNTRGCPHNEELFDCPHSKECHDGIVDYFEVDCWDEFITKRVRERK